MDTKSNNTLKAALNYITNNAEETTMNETTSTNNETIMNKNTDQKTVKLPELLTADLGWQLANIMLDKDLKPTLDDVKVGIQVLIPDFTRRFGKAEELSNGKIDWPVGKTGIVGDYYDRIEDQVSLVMSFGLNNLEGTELRNAALAVMDERDRAVPPVINHNDSREFDMDQLFFGTIADKTIYLMSRLNTEVRKTNPLVSQPMSSFSILDLQALLNLEITCRDSDDGVDSTQIDHLEFDDDDWGFSKSDASIRGTIEMELVEYEHAIYWQNSFKSFYEIGKGHKDFEHALKEQIEYRRESARAYKKEQAALKPVKGKKAA